MRTETPSSPGIRTDCSLRNVSGLVLRGDKSGEYYFRKMPERIDHHYGTDGRCIRKPYRLDSHRSTAGAATGINTEVAVSVRRGSRMLSRGTAAVTARLLAACSCGMAVDAGRLTGTDQVFTE